MSDTNNWHDDESCKTTGQSVANSGISEDVAGIAPDQVLKDFWSNNERFADLFNSVFFSGMRVISSEELSASDTELSKSLIIKGQNEKIGKRTDVAKRHKSGAELVIMVLENQQEIHYGMPLRVMIGDALVYLNNYNELKKINKEEGLLKGSAEYLSRIKKDDRLAPVMTLCVYYGYKPWDGPKCLKDMLDIPERFRNMVSDYRMNLIEVRDLKGYSFENDDVRDVFDHISKVYNKKKNALIETKLSREASIVVGAVTGAKKYIKYGMEMEESSMEMCEPMKEMLKEEFDEGFDKGKTLGLDEGKALGITEGIIAHLKLCRDMNCDRNVVFDGICTCFNISREKAGELMEKYWG